ncbi:MAG TPA: hypothetical protein VHX65_03965 [Pirellulales bacterium]|nr:hypothetical protein [Pirellulales bacterium]
MRLTLRTMLAYMDDILEPADHQDVGQKIEESEYATNLLHRIRDVTRQMRMGAPKVSGRGMGLDPNTVAEYLDNVLSGERVPDFERVCLESNVHLAEVAACHQILSLVLGEPAEVDPALRRRMYDLAARSQETGIAGVDDDETTPPPRTDIEPPELAAAAAAGAGTIALDGGHDAHVVPARQRPEVPEYLRASRRSRFWPIAITVLLAVCLLAAISLAMFGWDNNPTLKWLPWFKPANVAQNDNSKNGVNGNNPALPAKGGPAINGNTVPPAVVPGGNVAPGSTVNPAGNGSLPPLPPPISPAGASTANPVAGANGSPVNPASGSLPPGSASPSATGQLPALPPPIAGTNGGTNAALPPGSQAPPAGPPPGPGPVIGPAPANAVVGGPIEVGPAAGPTGNVPGAVAPGPTGGPPPVPPGPPAGRRNEIAGTAAPPGGAPLPANPANAKPAPTFGPLSERLGRMVSEQELLLRLPAGQTEWQRVSPGMTLGVKDRLLALPTFRPTITLSAGVTIQLLPETMIDLSGYDADGVPVVGVNYGRLILSTPGKPDVRLKLILGDTAGTLTFFDPDATAALEMRHILVPGTDPQTGLPKLAVALYATAGQIDWTGVMGAAGAARAVAPANQPLSLPNGGKLTAPARILLAGSSADFSGSDRELPHWFVSDPINPLDSRASQVMNETLDSKTSVTVGLKELVEHRRAENRSLAARSMALIDEFDPFASLLNDPDQRAVWPVEIESLQAALARGPVTAGKVRATFEKQRGKDGDDLYRLLWGYNKDQLQSGAAPVLVDDLDNDSLDFRVLSFYNLQKIVGKTFDYRPEATAANRAQPVRRWREQLKEGLIVPKGSPPSKAQATAAKTPDMPLESDASRGLEPPAKPLPNEVPSPIAPTPKPPATLPPPPNPSQD